VDPLQSESTRDVHVELTTRCNLRCVYCAVSLPSYHGLDMEPEMVQKAVAFLKARGVRRVHLNGHGETTVLRTWIQACRPLIDSFAVTLTSNFARPFTPEECQVLARLTAITVSLDTADAELLMRIRRRVRLPTVLANLGAIRTAAAALDLAGPRLTILSGIYDKNVYQLEGLARLAVEQAADEVVFWALIEHQALPRDDNVRPLATLTFSEQRRALASIDSALGILHDAGIPVDVCGGYVDELRERVNAFWSGP
jgi:molybdenum cofactor biosynthesis enzyme MoaA